MLVVHEVRSLFPVVIKWDDHHVIREELFYIDYLGNELRYADSGMPVEEGYFKKFVFDFINQKTPPLTVPPLPKRPEHHPENFSTP